MEDLYEEVVEETQYFLLEKGWNNENEKKNDK